MVRCSAALRGIRVLCSAGLLGVLISPGVLPAQEGRAVLLVVNQGDRDVRFLPPDLGTARGEPALTVAVGGVTGHEIAVSPDGRTAFVPIYGNSGVGKPGSDGRSIAVIDIPSRKVTGKIDFGHGVRPHDAVFDRTRGLLYVTTELDQSVSVIDPRTLAVVGAIPTGQAESHMLAISHDGRFGYTANVGPGSVSVLDLASRKTVAIISVAPEIQRISISNDDRRVFTADQTRPRLAMIDTTTNQLERWVGLPDVAYGTAVTKDGRYLLTTLRTAGKVAVLDLKTFRVVQTVEVPGAPTEVMVRPDGKVAYISCGEQVAVIEVGSWKVLAALDAGLGADGLGWVP